MQKNQKKAATNLDLYWANVLRYKVISRLALATVLVGAVLLIGAVLLFSDGNGQDYLSLMQSHSVTQENLPTMMILAGLFLVICLGGVSWGLALYASFRVAGPLYRLSRNLELAPGSVELLGVRKGDCFQDVSHQLHQAVGTMRDHYACIDVQLDQIQKLYEAETRDEEKLESMLGRLRENVHRARLD